MVFHRRRLFGLGIAAGLTCVLAGSASAQAPFGSFQQDMLARPTTSPYLNLLRGGSLTNNYYSLVRPQNQFRDTLQAQGRQISTVQTEQNTLQRSLQVKQSSISQLSATGHPTSFMSTGGYFPSGRGGR